VVWLDGLDIPLVRALEQSWASRARPAPPPAMDRDSSETELTAAGLVPRHSRYPDTGFPQVRWPWRAVRRALAAMAADAPRKQPVVLRYVNPRTGTWPLATMGAEAQWLRPGETTRPERRTGSGVLHVIEGRGESRIGDRVLRWEPGDCLAVPPWQWVEHRNLAPAAPAALFHLTDEPALRALGLWGEETGGQ
jgi:gentisate 1,2-dioxygenase